MTFKKQILQLLTETGAHSSSFVHTKLGRGRLPLVRVLMSQMKTDGQLRRVSLYCPHCGEKSPAYEVTKKGLAALAD